MAASAEADHCGAVADKVKLPCQVFMATNCNKLDPFMLNHATPSDTQPGSHQHRTQFLNKLIRKKLRFF